jgi:general secretion pathway protein A
MPDPHLLARYGLKYNPFLPAIPADALWSPPGLDDFCFRVEGLVMDGGFAMITGDPGLGKSKALHLLAQRLDQVGEVVVGVMERPQSALGDFYRELGELFGVDLSPANRYGGFKALRARWRAHIKSSLFRPVILIDEAQVVASGCLDELRLLGSTHFDSELLLTTVLCGDNRLGKRFRTPELLPLGSRIRTRLVLEPLSKNDLLDFLDHQIAHAGAPHLVTDGLKSVLVDHAAGNPRVLMSMGAELLGAGAARDRKQLDEKLFLEIYARPPRRQAKPRKAS